MIVQRLVDVVAATEVVMELVDTVEVVMVEAVMVEVVIATAKPLQLG